MTVERIGVELLEVGFSPNVRDWASNVAGAEEWLHAAFLAGARRYGFDADESALARLSEFPTAVMDWTLLRASGQADTADWPWMKDAAAAIYAFENDLNPDLERRSLSKAERRSADARADYFASTNRIWQRGRPVDVDVPLLLYLIFSIEVLIGRRIPLSRRNDELTGNLRGKKPPGGPAFRLLRAAYSLASVRHGVVPSGVETIYKVALIARADGFKEKLALVGLYPWAGVANPGLSRPEIVTQHPSQCAYAFAEVMARRRKERK